MKTTFSSPFLKWAGGKRRLLPQLLPLLPAGRRLIEPFVGAGSVFLAAGYEENLLADANPVLIALYKRIKFDVDELLDDVKDYFSEEFRNKSAYDTLRAEFNDDSTPIRKRCAIFIYLNKFGYNGLFRTNREGKLNTPYGYPNKVPKLPETEIRAFAQKIIQADLLCVDFEEAMSLAEPGDLIYCDPPYAPTSEKNSFTGYNSKGFGCNEQIRLADAAIRHSERGVIVAISNHDTEFTRSLYEGAEIHQLSAHRTIAGKTEARGIATEILAIFNAYNEARAFNLALMKSPSAHSKTLH